MLVGGILICVLGLPLLLFLLSRAMNPRGEPTVAARFGLLGGLLLAYLWFAYLFWSVVGILLTAVVGIAVLAILVVILISRR
ncbi:MAG: hypothetical protein C4321_06100 [Chloroflexota bacterium]